MSAQYSATLTSFHTASPDKDPYTIYVITVKRGAQQWQVFRRYREWEDLRTVLQQQTGSSPQMPGKMLFGRMRPEVIESRVVGTTACSKRPGPLQRASHQPTHHSRGPAH